MNDSNNDFDLQDLWQKTPPVDVDALLDSVTKAHKGMRRFFYYELVGSVVSFTLLVWAAFAGWFDGQLWLASGLGVFCVAFQIWSWTWRRDLWNAIAESPSQLLKVRRKHLLLDIKVAKSCYWSIIAGAVVGGTLSFFTKSPSRLDLTELQRGSILTFAAVVALGFLIWSIRKEITARKKLKVLDQKIKEFESEESL